MFNNRRGDAKWGFIEINEVLIWFNVCSPPTYVLFFFCFYSFFFYFNPFACLSPFLWTWCKWIPLMVLIVNIYKKNTVIKATFGLTPFYGFFSKWMGYTIFIAFHNATFFTICDASDFGCCLQKMHTNGSSSWCNREQFLSP